MAADLAREAALSALERCRRSGAWSSASIDEAIREYGLDQRARALTSAICLGVLQNMRLCDYVIDGLVGGRKLEPKVRDILRTAVYQLLFMDRIPASAAVNEAVALSKKLGYQRASGLVNAVLRKVADGGRTLPEITAANEAEILSIRYSHPVWLAEKLLKEYGRDFTESFFAANNAAADTAIQINTLKISTGDYLALLGKNDIAAQRHEWMPDCLLVKGSVTALPGYEDGLFYVQDPAAKASILAAGLTPGMSVLDACAAPGGKSFAAAIAMQNEGSILSRDLHEKKLRLIKEGSERLGFSVITVKAADARAESDGEFDAVIADVPCSGLGVIRKKPEIRFKTAQEIADLPEIQTAILQKLSESVKPGGVLIYSTCTVLREENEDIIRAFLKTRDDFVPEDFTLPNGLASRDGHLTLWPHINGTDGFFTAKLRRIR